MWNTNVDAMYTHIIRLHVSATFTFSYGELPIEAFFSHYDFNDIITGRWTFNFCPTDEIVEVAEHHIAVCVLYDNLHSIHIYGETDTDVRTIMEHFGNKRQ